MRLVLKHFPYAISDHLFTVIGIINLRAASAALFVCAVLASIKQ
ncbi:hypothetical protein N646_2107 [Vibrio alginolyticus NBRC 15630 = ATCC 17749]|uniref:Uncharacterized protein n=1 Tax=Vibrio alginolyticus (strain ATCC 17749 / DSM 2171 / NBRC 15630 / NCIMB 1903 / NCTC 12160 / XII-53) TaxID=1219076 RepID=A0A2I3CCJ3_VIBAX|nr:hypothetical protein N646_2107 [Vibrio alginolyticus NBRC 15630 = ATCC 17749]